MSAESLRRAAALMRERAEKATPGRWHRFKYIVAEGAEPPGGDVASTFPDHGDGRYFDAEHIASWHPAVALMAADAMDQHADLHDTYDCVHEPCAHEAWASAYLGERP